MRQLVARGQLTAWLEPGQRPGVRSAAGAREKEGALVTTYAENPADPGRCRHCGKPPYLHDPWPACDDEAGLAAAR